MRFQEKWEELKSMSENGQKSQKEQALRFNEGKPKLCYIPVYLLPPNVNFKVLERFSRVYEKGALKYGAYNYLKGAPTEQNIDSLLRHYYKGLFEKDEESGIEHCYHVLWNALTILYNWYKDEKITLILYRKNEILWHHFHFKLMCCYGLEAKWEFTEEFFRELCNFMYALIEEIKQKG